MKTLRLHHGFSPEMRIAVPFLLATGVALFATTTAIYLYAAML